jgi:TetR/AcrR family transcriptional regulator, transcriptional repressor for nem operon
MPYPVGHRAVVKRKIIQSARRLFKRHGFDNVSVQQIMLGAGLTHGGFYTYFPSKSALYTKVVGCSSTDPEWKKHWQGGEMEMASPEAAAEVVKAYLSRQHFEDVENSCAMVALPTDVMRLGDDAKRAFEEVFAAMVGVLERSVKDRKQERHAKAQAVAALCVGAMVVARSLENRVAADELRDVCRSMALHLGGWLDTGRMETGAMKNGARKKSAEEVLASVG